MCFLYWCWRFHWMRGCTRVCCSVVCFSVWRKKRTEQHTLVQPPTQQKRQYQNRTPCPSRQALSERPQSRKILNTWSKSITAVWKTLKRIIDKRILNSFKHIHETADNTNTKDTKTCNCRQKNIYIYIYTHIYTNQLIRRLFVDLIPNFPNQYQDN